MNVGCPRLKESSGGRVTYHVAARLKFGVVAEGNSFYNCGQLCISSSHSIMVVICRGNDGSHWSLLKKM